MLVISTEFNKKSCVRANTTVTTPTYTYIKTSQQLETWFRLYLLKLSLCNLHTSKDRDRDRDREREREGPLLKLSLIAFPARGWDTAEVVTPMAVFTPILSLVQHH